MTDLVKRLRASVTQCRAVDRSALLEEAAAEIARLRGDAEIARLRLEASHAEIARLQLTADELEALGWAMDALAGQMPEAKRETLRRLLERLGGGK